MIKSNILKKKWCCPIFLLAALSLLAACGAPAEKTENSSMSSASESTAVAAGILPSYNPEFFYLECENCHAELNYWVTTGRNLVFPLVSGQPLTQEDIDITLNIQTPYKVFLSERYDSEQYSKFSYYIYQCYQNVDWKHMAELASAAEQAEQTEDDESVFSDEERAYQEARDQYVESYLALSSDQVTELYFYYLYIHISLGENTPDETLDKLTISVKGITKTYNIGNIHLSSADPGIRWDDKLLSDAYGSIDITTFPTQDGRLLMSRLYIANTALTIESIELQDNTGAVIEKITIKIKYANGMSLDTLWNGESPIELSEGDKIDMKVICLAPEMAGALYGRTMKYLFLNYSIGGEKSRLMTEYSFRNLFSAYEIYAAECDGVDILSYYLDYHNSVFASKY